MKFTAKEDFRHGHNIFEEGNSYRTDIHGLSEDDLKLFWAAGWAEVEGWEPAPARKPGAQRLKVENLKVRASTSGD